MKINIEPTEKTTLLTVRTNGEVGDEGQMLGQLWQGETEDGTPVIAVLMMVVPDLPAEDPRQAMFEAALDEFAVPRPGVVEFAKTLEL